MKISDMGTLSDIGGMSGGPVFAFYRDDQGYLSTYSLIGIQSGWFKSKGLTGFCSMMAFLSALKPYIDDM